MNPIQPRVEPKVKIAYNELFALRDGEVARLVEHRPTSGRWIAVQLRTVTLPPGPYQRTRTMDGKPTEAAVVAAAQVNRYGLWQWIHLSPATKEQVADLVLDNGGGHNIWYYVTITQEGEVIDQPQPAPKQLPGYKPSNFIHGY